MRKEETEERAHRGETSEANRLRLLGEHLLHTSHKALMYNYMQTIANGHAQYHRSNAQRHQRHASLYPIHAGQREKGAVYHGQEILPDHTEAAEAHTKNQQYD